LSFLVWNVNSVVKSSLVNCIADSAKGIETALASVSFAEKTPDRFLDRIAGL
jgi:hypothetical protein